MNDDLFNKHIYLVEKIVNKMNYGYTDIDDLRQAGLIGLYKATQKYNSDKGNFVSFASIYIISEIKNELRNNKLIILNKNIIKVKKFLTNNNSSLTIPQISKLLNVSIDTVYLGLTYKNEIISLNEINDDQELINEVQDINNKDKFYYDINSLDNICKKIIVLKYYKNYSQEEIAKLLNISQSKVSRLEKRALQVLKQKCS